MEFQIPNECNSIISFFEYKNKKYPIKYEFFRIYLSNYPKKGNDDTIPLIDTNSYNDIDLTEESINSFINCVQHENIMITNDNLVQLNYLAKKYSFFPLINKTNEYISKYGTEFLLIFISKHQGDHHFKSKAYEDIIEENFFDCIKSERLLDIKINILYRIFRQYTIQHGQFVNSKILDFLFKCLNTFKIEASPFFEFVQFNEETKSYLDQLMCKGREGIFDIKFLNQSVIYYLHEKSSQMADYRKYHVGDILHTMRDLSDDKSWLECDGKCLNEDEHAQLYKLINSTPDEGKWHHHSILNKEEKYESRFCCATDGEYFVFIEIGKDFKAIVIYSTKNIDNENWKSDEIYLPDGYEIGRWMPIYLHYFNGEFVITAPIENNNSNSIYILHAKKPDEQWIPHLIQIKDLPKFICLLFNCCFLNNTYVISLYIEKCGDAEDGFVFLYGPSFSSLKINKKFCCKSENYHLPQIAYGDGQWAICMTCNNISNKIEETLIYVSDDLYSLSPDCRNKKVLFKWMNRDENSFWPLQFVYGNGQWVLIGQHWKGSDYETRVVYFDKSPLWSFTEIRFEGFEIMVHHTLYYCNAFYFLATNKSDNTVYLFYSTDKNLQKENWKMIQVCNRDIEPYDYSSFTYNQYSLSCNEQRNILFAVVRKDCEDSKFVAALYTPESSHRLPMISPVDGIKAYIKSSEYLH